MKSKIAVRRGRLGGLVKSEAKTQAARENAKLGGRPRKYPVCPKYGYHKFVNINHLGMKYCPCTYVCPANGVE